MARTPFRAIAVLSLSLMWGLAYAQDSEPYEADPPIRAARLSYILGEVSLQPAGEEEWAPALVNRPLTTGDKLWTEPNARAEIYVGPAAVRLDGATGFSFLNVDDDTIQMRLTAGVIFVSVRDLAGSEQIEIDTPNVALSLLRAGQYRVEVNDAGDSTVVKVSEGAAEAIGTSQNVVVHAQQVVTFSGTDNLVSRFSTLGAPDEFDSWSLDRDRRYTLAAKSRTAEYVSPDVTGYEDLEENGTWSSEPEYGYVWTPRHVAVDWAPYRYGRWVSISPWGWTWIDDARWGYAPFHYGRWAHVRNRWCWVPGPRHVRAVYAPALVGWGGHGGHVSWFPLGPREIYVPGRRYSRNYVERVNIANTLIANRSHLADVYGNNGGNARFRNRVAAAVTAASRNEFTSAGRIGEQRVRLNEQDLARSDASAMAPRIAAGRESRLGASRREHVRVPPQAIANRQVVVRRDPPPSVAQFARRPADNTNVEQAIAERVRRSQDRGQYDRSDRPRRDERPAIESAPRPQISVFDRHGLAERVREDGERQVREQQQREVERQRRDVEQRQQREQHQERERSQRLQDAVRQAGARQAEQRERREQQVQRERSYERPRTEQPRVQQPRVEQPRVERPQAPPPSRSEPQRPAESKPQSHRGSENYSRPNRQ